MNFKSKQRGYTLIELGMVVAFVASIAICGTLIYVVSHFIAKLW